MRRNGAHGRSRLRLRGRSPDPRLALVAAAAAAGLVTVAVATASVQHVDAAGQRTPVRHASTRSDPGPGTAYGGKPGTATAALMPAAGAYLGAYVQPATYTTRGEIDAILSFERQLGRPLGLVHVYHQWDSPFPSPADKYFVRSGKALLLTWSGTPDTRTIAAGGYDALIRQRAEAVKHLGRPILIEFRHEMDRPNLRWAMHSPADYIAAWDHIRSIFRAVGAANVSWVWCPTAYGFTVGRAQAFYPGNSEVDFVCADAYSPSPLVPLSVIVEPFLTWAAQHPKPAIIGEFGVGGNPAGWPSWLAAAGRLARRDTQIKALGYFSGNGTDSSGHPYKYFMGGHVAATRAFARLLAEPYFESRLPRA